MHAGVPTVVPDVWRDRHGGGHCLRLSDWEGEGETPELTQLVTRIKSNSRSKQ